MNKEKFKELDSFCTSYLNYSNFISDKVKRIDPSKVNFDQLICIYLTYYFTLEIDKYMERKDYKIVGAKIEPYYLKEIVSIVAKEEKTGWKLGELCYKTPVKVLAVLRGKLTHGNYTCENGEIIFDDELQPGKVGRVSIDKLLAAVSNLDSIIEDIQSRGVRNKILIGGVNLPKKVDSEESFDNLCKNLRIMTIIDEPTQGKKRNRKYVEDREELYQQINRVLEGKENIYNVIPEYKNGEKTFIKKYNITIKPTITSVYNCEYYDDLKNFYKEKQSVFSTLNGIDLYKLISNKLLKISKGKSQTFNASRGIALNLGIIKELRENPYLTIEKIRKKHSKLDDIFLYDKENLLIGNYLAGFYSFFQKGFEKVLYKEEAYLYSKENKGETFDFSKLDLSELDYPNMTISFEKDTYTNDIKKYEQKLEAARKKYKIYLENCKNYIKNHPKQEIPKRLLEIVKSSEEDYENTKKLLEDVKKYYSVFDHEKYIRNYNILKHIRNAISHGHVYINETDNNEDIKEKKIRIINSDKYGNILYDKEVTLGDFLKIFKSENINELSNFIKSNLKDEPEIAESTTEELKEAKVRKIVK